MSKKLPKTTEYDPKEIARNMHLQISYETLISAARKNGDLKSAKNVREDLMRQLSSLTREELIEYDRQVKEEFELLKLKNDIKILRHKLSKKEEKLNELRSNF